MPKDGSMQAGPASVSLLAPSAAYSDAMTTALCLMQPQEILDFTARELDGAHVVAALYAADSTQLEVITTLGDDLFTIEDDAYHLVSVPGENGVPVYTGSLQTRGKPEIP